MAQYEHTGNGSAVGEALGVEWEKATPEQLGLPPNASQAEIQAAKAAGREKQSQDIASGQTEGQNDDLRKQLATQAYNPGSAEVGGGAGNGQFYHDQALGRMHEGDAAYAANEAAMGRSIANMSADRGVVSPENDALLRREGQSRDQQAQGLDMQREAAMGGAPSAAAFQTRMAMNDNMAGQAAASGSARGLGALNGVQGVGAAGAGNSAGGIGMTGGMGRSKEMSDAVGMYGSNSGIMRQGDITRLRDGDTNSLGNADLNNNWKLGNAGLAAKQGQLGVEQDKMRGNWFDAASEPAKKQAEFDQTMKGIEHGQSASEASAAVAADRAERDRNKQVGGQAAVVGLSALGSLAGPAGTAAGGMGGSLINSYIQNGGKK